MGGCTTLNCYDVGVTSQRCCQYVESIEDLVVGGGGVVYKIVLAVIF